ncbi:MAG: AAA family ATPase [Candidatus Pacebacteria bacterium]|nr:AAA family ATPase [Candidatus Paceibacterota bacterium]MCF7862954.1 AAA family ATPase [Candidatus Paceibacterota bacterium]
MRLQSLVINGFKSFAKKTSLVFESPIVCVVGPNGSGKSNVLEAIRFVLGEQSMKSMRGRSGSDMVFKGSKNLSKGSKAEVSIYFDNKDNVFKMPNEEGESISLDFDTVSISREVYTDGMNKYVLNDSEVRLKDINALLASVNIGSSGHHIISQGEADRILNANSRERKEMIEDALGLKIYQYKIKDTERKLEKTGINMQEVSMLRRENAPHLNFLKKQVEKIEKATEMSEELFGLYLEYLKKENILIGTEYSKLSAEKKEIDTELKDLEGKIQEVEDIAEGNGEDIQALSVLENKVMDIRRLKSEMERKLGRVEGMMEAEIERSKKIDERIAVDPLEAQKALFDLDKIVEEAISTESIEDIKIILERIKNILKSVLHKEISVSNDYSNQIATLEESKKSILVEIDNLTKEENNLSATVLNMRQENREKMEAMREKEKEKFGLKVRHQELVSALGVINLKEENLSKRKEDFENEIKEGRPLVGERIHSFEDFEINVENNLSNNTQEELKRRIERIKIKLEDAGLAGSGDVMKEYKEATERDVFLLREMEDLANSIESLKKLMVDLKEKIDTEFKEGVRKINKEFQELFVKMFGGGTASLQVVMQSRNKTIADVENEDNTDEEEIVFEQGVDINVSLPHKKVKELHALSGGERSLTSIALLFAMSQVNPPPFLVLDETDAALDESNSRKYGDMLEILSKHSQLIVITHNRETMSRAGVLYGVTIGADGASKLLSVRFDEAVAIAK